MNFVSMHSFGEEPVDCRFLQIEFKFFRATCMQTKELAKYCILEIEKLLEDSFFLDWRWTNNHRIKGTALEDRIKKTDSSFAFRFLGNERNSEINNCKALDTYSRDMFHQLTFSNEDMTAVSEDYWDIYYKLFSNTFDSAEIKHNLLHLFRIENRFFKKRWFGSDVSGKFHTQPYQMRPDLFWGHFEFRIALQCLDDGVVEFSDHAVSFLNRTIHIVPDICGHILLSPYRPPSYCTSHMHYFGGTKRYCPVFREPYMTDHEWSQFYFLSGVEWYNLLSPLQRDCLKGRILPPNITLTPMPNGGYSVAVKKSIVQMQISDLYTVKQFLYPILYPGGLEIPINYLLDPSAISYIVKPRCQWENIPVFEHEAEVFFDKIVLSYQPEETK